VAQLPLPDIVGSVIRPNTVSEEGLGRINRETRAAIGAP